MSLSHNDDSAPRRRSRQAWLKSPEVQSLVDRPVLPVGPEKLVDPEQRYSVMSRSSKNLRAWKLAGAVAPQENSRLEAVAQTPVLTHKPRS
jgi:hypothetical protein